MGKKLGAVVRNNILGLIAIFIALGGTAYAATVVSSNSQIAANTVSGHHPTAGKHANVILGTINGADVFPDSLTGPQIKESSLKTVPSAYEAYVAGYAANFNQMFSFSFYPGAGFYLQRGDGAVTRATDGVYCVHVAFPIGGGAATIDAGAGGYPLAFMSIKTQRVADLCGTGYEAVVTTYASDTTVVISDQPVHAIFY